MSKFKAGDRVRCIDRGHNGRIRVDGEYTIGGVDAAGDPWLVEVGAGYQYFACRFELVAPPPAREWQVGDVVELLDIASPKPRGWQCDLKPYIGTTGVIEKFATFSNVKIVHVKRGAERCIAWPTSALKLITPASSVSSTSDEVPSVKQNAIGFTQAPSSPTEVLTLDDYGTTPTDRKMRAERVRRQLEQDAKRAIRALDAHALQELEGRFDPDRADLFNRYVQLTGCTPEDDDAEGNA